MATDVAMRVGLVLPQFNPTVAGEGPGWWPQVQECARRAEGLGFDSLWLTDDGYDPLAALGALARLTSRVRMGTLGLAISRRPVTVVAKALSTIDVVSGGRLVVGLRARPEDGPARLTEACQVLVGMFGGGPFSFAGTDIRVSNARCLPLPVQRPHPPIWLTGESDGLLDVVAGHAQGWHVAWAGAPEAYRRSLVAMEAACDRVGRDPSTVSRSLGVGVLVGEDEADLQRRLRLCATPTADWRRGGLAGTVEEVGHRLGEVARLGVDTVIVDLRGVPLSATDPDDVAMLASACSLKRL